MAKYKEEERLREAEMLYIKKREEEKKKENLILNNPLQALESFYEGEIIREDIPSYSPLYYVAQNFPPNLSRSLVEERQSFYKICRRLLEEKAEILEYETISGHVRRNELLEAIACMCVYNLFFVRDITTWEKKTHNIEKQFFSIIDHLFVKKQVPEFMYSVWNAPRKADHIDWFIMMGEGLSIKGDKKLPCGFTSKMLHHFMNAPSDYTVSEALIWGRVKAFGGDERLVNSICESRLRNLQFNEFWDSVIKLFASNSMLDSAHIAPIVDFLYNQKYEVKIHRDAEGNVLGAPRPEQPNLSLKGRTIDSLLRDSEHWHNLQSLEQKRVEEERRLAVRGRAAGAYLIPTTQNLCWKPIGFIREFEKEEGNKDNKFIYKIVELLSSVELREEGSTMGHCVGSYSSSCASGRSTIWSLRMKNPQGIWSRLITIEINPGSLAIVQARGKRNCSPDNKEKQIMLEWANREGIKMSRWV